MGRASAQGCWLLSPHAPAHSQGVMLPVTRSLTGLARPAGPGATVAGPQQVGRPQRTHRVAQSPRLTRTFASPSDSAQTAQAAAPAAPAPPAPTAQDKQELDPGPPTPNGRPEAMTLSQMYLPKVNLREVRLGQPGVGHAAAARALGAHHKRALPERTPYLRASESKNLRAATTAMHTFHLSRQHLKLADHTTFLFIICCYRSARWSPMCSWTMPSGAGTRRLGRLQRWVGGRVGGCWVLCCAG